MTAEATRRKTIHIHIGPHKTGSTAIQTVMRAHAGRIVDACEVTPVQDRAVRQLAKAMLREDEAAALDALAAVTARCAGEPGDCLISSEDFAGDLPGRSAKRRIYPRLWKNLTLLRSGFPDCTVRFYFFRREPEPWLRSAYVQLLKHRARFSTFEGYLRFLNGVEEMWDAPLRKPRNRLGADFIEIPYREGPDFCAARAFFDALADRRNALSLPDMPRPNATPSDATVRILEEINRAGASAEAKRNAKALLLDGQPASPSATAPPGSGTRPEPVARPGWLSPELSGLWSRTEQRMQRQAQPNLLPEADCDLVACRTRTVPAPDTFPEGGRGDMENQARILAYRFRDLPETCYLLGLAISYLRRNTDHTGQAFGLFHRLWAEEHALLLGLLPTRWLISTFQTFVDHGANETQRMIGAGAYFFANTLKLHEAERALDGLPPDGTYPNAAPVTKTGFAGLDRFRLGGTDLMLNTNALLLELAARDAAAGRVVQEFMLRLKAAHSAFSRMDRSRIAHGIDIPQFANCWSFFDKPS